MHTEQDGGERGYMEQGAGERNCMEQDGEELDEEDDLP